MTTHKPFVSARPDASSTWARSARVTPSIKRPRRSRREGIEDFLVHGGQSSLYAAGDHNRQGGWPIGIRNPLFTEQRYATVLLRDSGMSTSGSNIQYFRHGGKRYGHILDPRTGWPAHSPETESTPDAETVACPDSLLSVTVLTSTAAEADALFDRFLLRHGTRKGAGLLP